MNNQLAIPGIREPWDKKCPPELMPRDDLIREIKALRARLELKRRKTKEVTHKT